MQYYTIQWHFLVEISSPIEYYIVSLTVYVCCLYCFHVGINSAQDVHLW